MTFDEWWKSEERDADWYLPIIAEEAWNAALEEAAKEITFTGEDYAPSSTLNYAASVIRSMKSSQITHDPAP